MDITLRPPQSPSSILPPLRRLEETTAPKLGEVMTLLRALYLPEVRGTSVAPPTPKPLSTSHPRPTPQRIVESLHRKAIHSNFKSAANTPSPSGTSTPVVDSGYASEVSDDEGEGDDCGCEPDGGEAEALVEAWALARADEFERSFALRWLTGLIARAEEWAEQGVDDEEAGETIGDTIAARLSVVEGAAALLAACAGTSASGPLIRAFRFPHKDQRQPPVQINLRDAALDSQDHTGVGLQTWGSSCLLAERLVREPEAFELEPWTLPGPSGKLRVLELGAGTGLLSLVLGKLLGNAGEDDNSVEILATDFHQAVLSNLRENVSSNFPLTTTTTPQVHSLDWQEYHNALVSSPASPLSQVASTVLASQCAPFNAAFDVIIGADIIYEALHSSWIKSCVQIFLRRPSVAEPVGSIQQPLFHLILPLRPTHQVETASIPATFPTAEDIKKGRTKGRYTHDELELAIVGVEELSRVAGTGRADEVRYLLYRIGWV